MSSNLNLPEMAEGQSAPEVTFNDVMGIVDAALTEIFTADFTSTGHITITDPQMQQMVRINLINATVVGRQLSLQAIKRFFIITADAGNTQTVQVNCGSTSVNFSAGDSALCLTDGTSNGFVVYKITSSAGLPYDLNFFVGGIPAGSETVAQLVAVRTFTLPASLTGSQFKSSVAATGTPSFTIEKNGSSIGSVAWAASGSTGTPTFASPVTFAPGDILSIVSPASPDATLANISFAFLGTR